MRQKAKKKMSVHERLVAAGEVENEPVTARDVAMWMAEALCHPPYTLSQRSAARSIAELFSAQLVSARGRTVSESVARELRVFLGSYLQSDTKRRRWRMTRAGRQKRYNDDIPA